MGQGAPLPDGPTPPDGFGRSRTLSFACHGCGDCCKGSTILLSPFDLARLCAQTDEAPRAFVRQRCMVLKHPFTTLPALMLESVPRCSLLDDDNRCTAYAGRPLVCRGYPLGVRVDLAGPRWSDPLANFTLRANPCPPRPAGAPLPMAGTLHAWATAAGMEPYAEAYRAWARLTWDIAQVWHYRQLAAVDLLAFDQEFTRTFYYEVEAPTGEAEALVAFLLLARVFRARHHIPASSLSTPPAAPTIARTSPPPPASPAPAPPT